MWLWVVDLDVSMGFESICIWWLLMGVVVVVGLNLYDCRGGEFGVNGGEDRL